MAKQSRSNRVSRELERNTGNSGFERSATRDNNNLYSREARQGDYAKQRSRRTLKRRLLIGACVTLITILVAGSATAFGMYLYLQNALSTDSAGHQLDTIALDPLLADRAAPEDPFWMLLAGTDTDEYGVSRSDTIILARIDPAHRKAALISIPRDTMITTIPGVYREKINAAYTYGELDAQNGGSGSGPGYCIQAVSDLTGVQISAYAQVDFNGLIAVVDAMGGVTVDVPIDIIGDRDAGPVDVYAGEQQLLDGQSALVFARSRQYEIGDFQRQANQRTLLQAIAKQILAQDPLSIANTLTQVCQMTTTTLDVGELITLATSMRGMQESDIYTYSIPSGLDMIDEISYVVADEYATRELINSLNNGVYPDYSGQAYQGETTDRYKPQAGGTAVDNLAETGSSVDATLYAVAVRNGYGIAGSATAVSNMLTGAGYNMVEVGNANSMVYKETIIIYRDDSDRAAADDIRARLGYGRVIPSLGRYSFEGNVLVVVGGDFRS